MSHKRNTFFKAALILTILSALSKILGFMRELVIAEKFGAGAAADSYTAAFGVATLLSSLLGGVIASAFMPVFSAKLAQRSGRNLAGTVLAVTVSVSLATSIVVLVFAPQIVSVLVRGFSAENQALTASLLRIMAVLTLIMSMSHYLTILFQAHKLFVLPALTPIIMSIIVIGGLLRGGNIQWLSWVTVLGMLIPVALMLFVAWWRGIPLITQLDLKDPALKKVMELSAPLFVGSLFGQFYIIVDRMLASGLASGSLAALNYGNKLAQLPLGVFVMAIGAAVYPTLSEHAAVGDMDSFAKVLSSGLRGVMLLIVPATAGLLALRYPIVQLAFERGSFDVVATTRTALAMAYYAVGLLGGGLALILGRGYYSLQDTLTPVKIGVATAVVNLVFAYILVGPMGHGGLALANSLGLTFGAATMYYYFRRKLPKLSAGLVTLFGKLSLASIALAMAALATHKLTMLWGQMISLCLAIGVGGSVYGMLLIVLRVEEVTVGIKVIRVRLGL